MLKKALVSSISVLFLLFAITCQSLATGVGEPDLTLTSSDATTKPPVIFPHKKHQDAFKCGECHHGSKDGIQVPYSEGMEIQKCETCHNPDVLAGKTKGKDKLDTFKGAGHANCLSCHKEVANNDSSKKKLKSCKTCHVK